MEETKKEKINYESLIAGLLLKLETIDNIDFSMLIADFEKKTGEYVWGVWYAAHNIGKYITCQKKGTVCLKDSMTLDTFIEEENKTLREKLVEIAGNRVNDYINNLDVEEYKEEKEKALKDNKEKVLNKANVLLISDIQDDYDELIKYGFKNVDYFKSIVRADAYFAEHPEELQKYQIIIKGKQNVQHCCFGGDVELDRRINQLREAKHILTPNLYRYDYPDYIELVTYLGDRNNQRDWDTEENSYPAIFDRIVENTLINHTLEKVGLKDTKFVPIEDKTNPDRLPLPTKKSDLKILYMDPIKVNILAPKIAEELQLNITFKEDNNCSLGEHVKTHLGDYDIIIASQLYSRSLLSMNTESTEQCKDTGRELTLLASYDNLCWGVNVDIADGIKIDYRFGGQLAPDSDLHSKEFRVLRQQIEIEGESESRKEYLEREYSKMRAIIETSVNFYNDSLLQIGQNAISDLNLNTADDLDNEYISVVETERKRKEAEVAPIKTFDNIRNSIFSYLSYRRDGLISQAPEGLIVNEGKDCLRVENLHEGRPLCAIVLPKSDKYEGLRIFEIQTISKKGTLSIPSTADGAIVTGMILVRPNSSRYLH